MKIEKASYKIEAIMPEDVMAHLERCGRTCYRSEGKIDDGVLFSILHRYRNSGFETYLLPQGEGLPLSNRREDILIVRR